MNFLLGILEGGGSVDEHPLIQHLLDLFWLLMEVWCTFMSHQLHEKPCSHLTSEALSFEKR